MKKKSRIPDFSDFLIMALIGTGIAIDIFFNEGQITSKVLQKAFPIEESD